LASADGQSSVDSETLSVATPRKERDSRHAHRRDHFFNIVS
jgi:hypothetical protein